jgi:hypothetical protein
MKGSGERWYGGWFATREAAEREAERRMHDRVRGPIRLEVVRVEGTRRPYRLVIRDLARDTAHNTAAARRLVRSLLAGGYGSRGFTARTTGDAERLGWIRLERFQGTNTLTAANVTEAGRRAVERRRRA